MMISLDTFRAGTIENGTTGCSWFVPSKVNDLWQWSNPQMDSLPEKAALKAEE